MYKLKRLLVWIRRMRYSRGFGVQSPWAYRLIRYVFNEHYPYYAYGDLKQSVVGIPSRMRKLCRLYFRIANHKQADEAWLFNPDSKAYATYISAGCRRTRVMAVNDGYSEAQYHDMLAKTPYIDLLIVRTQGHWRQFVAAAWPKARRKTVFVVQHIKRNRDTRRFWREVERETPGVITFDLYYCGIIYFDDKRYKQNYIVNF